MEDKRYSCEQDFFAKKKLDKSLRLYLSFTMAISVSPSTRVNISTPFIPVHVSFDYSVTNYTGSTEKERRLSQSTRNP